MPIKNKSCVPKLKMIPRPEGGEISITKFNLNEQTAVTK